MQPEPMTAAEATRIREDYEELIRTPGWQRFVEYVTDRYTGAGYFSAMNQALTNPTSPTEAFVLNATAKQMMTIVSHPLAVIRDLKGDSE